MVEKIIWIDCETGGLFAGTHSLLTVALAVTDENLNIIAEKEWKVKSNTYNVDVRALQVNNIDLIKHDAEAQKPLDVITEMNSFLESNVNEGDSCLFGGHNLKFDLEFISYLYKQQNSKMTGVWSNRYKQIDTCGLLRILSNIGIVKEPVFKLQEALTYFDISSPVEQQHTAIGDVRKNIELYKILSDIILGGADNV